jgi:hypothetical protein
MAAGMTLAVETSADAATSVTTCGQEVTGGGSLANDLDCTGTEYYAVLLHSGTLALNGFTITGGFGIFCDGPCKVVGPGTVTGSSVFGINGFGSSLKVTNVTLTDNGFAAVQCRGSCAITGPAGMTGNGSGVRAGGKLKISNLAITDNQFMAIDASNNASSARVTARNVTITGNRAGILADGGMKIIDSTISNNAEFGVKAALLSCEHKATVAAKGSTITGNDTSAECGVSLVCFDVGTCFVPPRLKTTTCEHSYDYSSGNPGNDWNACSLD